MDLSHIHGVTLNTLAVRLVDSAYSGYYTFHERNDYFGLEHSLYRGSDLQNSRFLELMEPESPIEEHYQQIPFHTSEEWIRRLQGMEYFAPETQHSLALALKHMVSA